MNWYDDLCEYYGVSAEEADVLGTRKTGRRPNFPGSETCDPVSGKSMDEYWDSKERKTLQEKMDFYKDIGAWLSFRQCKYRSNFNYRRIFFSRIKDGCSIVEYGCGVAPLTNYIIERYKGDLSTLKFHLVDVASEPLKFAKWRLNKKAPDLDVIFHDITADYPVPVFDVKFDVVCIMDVFEHLPNPYAVMTNLTENAKEGAFLVETWREGGVGGCDLQEAEDERSETMRHINEYWDITKKGSHRNYLRNSKTFEW